MTKNEDVCLQGTIEEVNRYKDKFDERQSVIELLLLLYYLY